MQRPLLTEFAGNVAVVYGSREFARQAISYGELISIVRMGSRPDGQKLETQGRIRENPNFLAVLAMGIANESQGVAEIVLEVQPRGPGTAGLASIEVLLLERCRSNRRSGRGFPQSGECRHTQPPNYWKARWGGGAGSETPKQQ